MKTSLAAKVQDRACIFCVKSMTTVDFKDTMTLRRYISSYGKIVPRRRSGVCALHQRKLARAIKQARINGLLPFVID